MVDYLEKNSLNQNLDDSITSIIRRGKHEEALKHALNLDEILRLYYQIQTMLDQSGFIESQELIQKGLDLIDTQSDSKIEYIWCKMTLYLIYMQLLLDPIKGMDSDNKFLVLPNV